MSYQGPGLDVVRFFAEVPAAAATAGFAVETYGTAAGWPLLALRKDAAPPDAPTFYISAGIHGDEPAGPLALLRLLQENFFDARHNWLLLPMLNPGGLAAKTRENPDGMDANRDYRHRRTPETAQHVQFLEQELAAGRGRYALSLCLHEDWESKGFYLYELNRTTQPLLGFAVLEAVAPICGVDLSSIIETLAADRGLITRPLSEIEERPDLPEAIYLVRRHTDRSLTLEAPSAQELERRVAALAAAILAAVTAWKMPA